MVIKILEKTVQTVISSLYNSQTFAVALTGIHNNVTHKNEIYPFSCHASTVEYNLLKGNWYVDPYLTTIRKT